MFVFLVKYMREEGGSISQGHTYFFIIIFNHRIVQFTMSFSHEWNSLISWYDQCKILEIDGPGCYHFWKLMLGLNNSLTCGDIVWKSWHIHFLTNEFYIWWVLKIPCFQSYIILQTSLKVWYFRLLYYPIRLHISFHRK